MSSREAFEAWVDSNFPFKKDRFDLFRGEYKSQFTEQLWQSWQASREGLDAKLKSAENNDVDARCHVAELEAKCAALAAESSATNDRLQKLIQIISNTDNDYCMCGDAMKSHVHGGCGHPTGMFDYHYNQWLQAENQTQSATDAFLAEVRAQGVEMFAAVLRRKGDDAFFDAIAEAQANAADQFAAQLRKGVQS